MGARDPSKSRCLRKDLSWSLLWPGRKETLLFLCIHIGSLSVRIASQTAYVCGPPVCVCVLLARRVLLSCGWEGDLRGGLVSSERREAMEWLYYGLCQNLRLYGLWLSSLLHLLIRSATGCYTLAGYNTDMQPAIHSHSFSMYVSVSLSVGERSVLSRDVFTNRRASSTRPRSSTRND